MEVDVLQRHAVGPCGVFEADIVKIHAAVRNVIDGVGRVMQVAFLVEHLADTFCRGGGHCDHDEDHREHHKTHQDLHGVSDHARERADIEIRAAGLDDELCRKVADENAADGDAELHEGAIEGEDFFGLQEVLAHVVRLRGKFLRLIVLTHEALDHAHGLHVFLHGVVEPVVFFEHGLEKRHRSLCHQIQAEAQHGDNAREDEGQLLADADGHDARENQHHRRAHRHTGQHHERLLDVCNVGGQTRDERGRREPVDIREREVLHLIIEVFAQISREACRRRRAEPARGRAAGKREHRNQKQLEAIAEDDVH